MPDANSKVRLPPGQNLTRELPVMHVGSVPHFDPEHWSLRIEGLVQTPVTIDHEEFKRLPRVNRVSDLHCVSTWTAYRLEWEGVPLRTLLHRARPLPDARFAVIHADGGYTTSVPLAALLEDDVLLADGLNGQELPARHGYPARLVIPELYAYKSAKWVRSLEITAEDRPGFWESRGYSNSADPWTEDRFAPLPPPESGAAG